MPTSICEICNLPITTPQAPTLDSSTPKPHETTLAHQICLEHSYPPSHLDRNRHGLKYLASYGWDPDSRRGLGAAGEGILVPIKAKKVKNDTVGLGVEVPKRKAGLESGGEVERLDAKGTRKREVKERERGVRLREIFYQSEDVVRYLGGG